MQDNAAKPPIVTAVLVAFSANVSVRVLDPVVPRVALEFERSIAETVTLITSFSVTFALVQPLVAALGDRYGKLNVIAGSLMVAAIATLVGAVAPSFGVLLAARIVAGAATGALMPLSFATLADFVEPKKRQATFGFVHAGILTGNFVGAFGSGLLAELVNWRAPLVALDILLLIALATALSVNRRLHGQELPAPPPPAPFEEWQKGKLAVVCLLTALAIGTSMFGLFPLVGLLTSHLGNDQSIVAGAVLCSFAFGGLSFVLNVSTFLRILGRSGIVFVGAAVAASAIILIGSAISIAMLALGYGLLGLGFNMLMNSTITILSEIAPARRRGLALSINSLAVYLGAGIGPLLYVGLAPIVPIHVSLPVSALVVALVAGSLGLLVLKQDAVQVAERSK
jgi:MFS transporter, DHA1 family, inner membrane transport protein